MSSANKVNMDDVRRRAQQAQAKKDARGITWWKPKDGANMIRILPPWSKAGQFVKEAGYHYNVADKTALACPKESKNDPCPICEAAKELFKSRRPEDMELAKRIQVKKRFFYNILDRTANDGKVYVFGSGSMVYEGLLEIFSDPDYGDITDPDNGYDIKLKKRGEGLGTEYTVMPDKSSTPVKKWDKKKEDLTDLDALVEGDLRSYKDLKGLLEGTETEAEDEDEEDDDKEKDDEDEEKGDKSGRKGKDDEEGEDEEDDGDEDEKDTKASRKSKDEEDEDSDEDDKDDSDDEEKEDKKSSKKDRDEEEDEDEEDDDKDEKKGNKSSKETEEALDRLRKLRRKDKK